VVAAQAQLQVKTAESFRIGEISKREADAAVAEAQNRAMAKAALAEAERVEAEQRAKLEAPAKAEKARTIVEAEAAAERRRIEANAEAAAIYAKLEAEARGQFEIMSKKADGLARVVAAAGGDARAAFQLLMVEQIPMLADSAARAVQNIKFDKVVVWDSGHPNGGAAGFVQNVAHAVPPIMQVLKDVAGIDLPPVLGALKDEALVQK
jgi:flotillin